MSANYNDFTKEQLINLLIQRDAEILLLKRGYIYVIQFENDIAAGVFKAGKTGSNIETRFGNYRTVFSDELGALHIIRVGAVCDSLAAERYMHELIRSSGVQCLNDEKRNKKSPTKCEWYIDHDMELIEKAFEKTMNKYGLDADDMVKKYDIYAKGTLDDELKPITHYKEFQLIENMYFYHPSTKTVYKQMTYGKDVMKVQKSTGKYGMKKIDSKSCSVPLEYLVKEYA